MSDLFEYPANRDLYYRFYFDPDGWLWVHGWEDLSKDKSVIEDADDPDCVWHTIDLWYNEDVHCESWYNQETILQIEQILCDMFDTDSVRGKMFDVSFDNYCEIIDLLYEIKRCEVL